MTTPHPDLDAVPGADEAGPASERPGRTVDPDLPGQVAALLRAVLDLVHAAATPDQRREARRVANRWLAAVDAAGWSQQAIAAATGLGVSNVSARVQRGRELDLAGVGAHAVPLAPRRAQQRARQQLLRPAQVAELVGCQPGSVKAWAQARGVPHVRSASGRNRLYHRDHVEAAVARRPFKAKKDRAGESRFV